MTFPEINESLQKCEPLKDVAEYIKGKSVIYIVRTDGSRRYNFSGHNFGARGYFVSTVCRDENTVRKYIKKQEEFDRKLTQLELF